MPYSLSGFDGSMPFTLSGVNPGRSLNNPSALVSPVGVKLVISASTVPAVPQPYVLALTP